MRNDRILKQMRRMILEGDVEATPLDTALAKIGPRPRGKAEIKAWKRRRVAARKEHGHVR